MLNVAIELFLGISFYFFLCFILGSAIPRKFIPDKSGVLERVIFGWAILNLLLRLPYRDSLPAYVGYLTVLLFGFLGLACYAQEFINKKITFRLASTNLKFDEFFKLVGATFILIAPGLMVTLGPLILSGAVFYHHIGPDIYGNLVSTAYLVPGNVFNNLLLSFEKSLGNYEWWLSAARDPWNLDDIQASIAIEFFIRSVRWGHAVVGVFLDYLFGQKVWFGLLVQSIFSLLLLPLILLKQFTRLGLTKATSFLITLLIVTSQSYVVMHYEGINVQLICTPFLIYLLFSIDKIFNTQNRLKSLPSSALIISAIITFFGEGIQLFGFYIIAIMLGSVIFNIERSKFMAKSTFINLVFLAVLVFILSSAFIYDYLFWNIVRARDKFIGGALNYDFMIMPILFSFPYLKLDANIGTYIIHLTFKESYLLRLVESSVILAFGSYVAFRYKRVELFAIAFVLFVVSITGHKYAIWKTAVIFQPLFIIYLVNFCYFRCRSQISKAMLNTITCLLLIAAVYGLISTLKSYERQSQKILPTNFEIQQNNIMGSYVVITPSVTDNYLLLATSGPLIWLNNNQRLFGISNKFSDPSDREMQIASYYDCVSEGAERCKQIQKARPELKEGVLYGTDKKVIDFLDEWGRPDKQKIKNYQNELYGLDLK